MRQLLLSCLVLFACAHTPSGTAGEGQLRIEVVNSSNHRLIKDARVFVLSEEGKELASAKTDDRGIAFLQAPTESQRPKYVLVEHPAFFLSGMRWQVGLEHYYILVTILTVR